MDPTVTALTAAIFLWVARFDTRPRGGRDSPPTAASTEKTAVGGRSTVSRVTGFDRAGSEGDDIAALIAELATSTEAFCALSAALAVLCGDDDSTPELDPALAGVVSTLGLDEVLSELDRAELVELHAAVKARLEQAYQWTVHPTTTSASRAVGRSTLSAYELASEALAAQLHARVVPQLSGLRQRLDGPRAMLLIAGGGAGGLAIALCETWPRLSGVGIDSDASAIARARRRVEQAGLSSRIELRVQDVGELRDRDAFDLAWLPVAFVGADVLPGALRRVRHATRSGGWVIASVFAGRDARAVALARLRVVRAGGTFISPAETRSLLRATGWTGIRSLPRDTLPSIWMTAGRRR